MFKLKQKGMSLVEVTVAGAVAVGLSLGIMQLNQSSFKGANKVKTDTELTDFQNYLKMHLAKGGNCALTLEGAGYTVGAGAMALGSLNIELSSTWDAATRTYVVPATPNRLLLTANGTTPIPKFPNWKVDSINIEPLTNIVIDPHGHTSGTCVLKLGVNRSEFTDGDSKRTFGARNLEFSIPLSCSVDPLDATKIGYCISDTTVRMGFWSLAGVLPTEGINYDYSVSIGENLIVGQHVIVESDQRIKEKITPLENSLEKISSIKGYKYNLKNKTEPQIGLLAQEVEKIYPEAVETKLDGTKGVRYSMLIPVLVDALKEQQKIIQEQNKKIEKIEKELINQNLRKVD